ncbi:MAG: hypothetical protein PUP90_01920 [Nostoc sp. S4]|nr:hypothetical protein [Nostoc sp. S4]
MENCLSLLPAMAVLIEHRLKFTDGYVLWVRVSQNQEASLSEAIMDSQSVETGNFFAKSVIRATTSTRIV